MGNLKSLPSDLEDLQSRARNLTETGLALTALFNREETRLNRENEASRLRSVYSAIVEQLGRLREIESSASRGHGKASLILSVAELAVTATVSRGKSISAIADSLLHGATDRQHSFGLVMVCIGPRGLPDDVEAVSISQLARESNRPQPEIINKLQDDGYLLFGEEAFSALISRLIGDVDEGKLHLPVSRDRLVEIAGQNKQKLRVKITEVE
jgi:hypothetical protein